MPPRPYQGPRVRPHMRMDLSFQTMMSTQVRPANALTLLGGSVCAGLTLQFTMSFEPSSNFPMREAGDGTSVFSAIARNLGGARRDRTDDLMLAKHALYQLSYGPFWNRSARAVIDLSARGVTRRCGGPRQTRTADLTLIRRVL